MIYLSLLGVNGVTAYNIARFFSDGRTEPMDGGLNGRVTALHCPDDGNVIVGGDFMCSLNSQDPSLCKQPMESITRWNGKERAWNPMAYGGLNKGVKQIKQGLDSWEYLVLGAYVSTSDLTSLNQIFPVSGIVVEPQNELRRFLGCIDSSKETSYLNSQLQELSLKLPGSYNLRYLRIWSDKVQSFKLQPSNGSPLSLKFMSENNNYQTCTDSCSLGGKGNYEMFVIDPPVTVEQVTVTFGGTDSVKAFELFHDGNNHIYIKKLLFTIM